MANKPLRGINFPGLEDTYMTAGYPTEEGGEIFNDYENNKAEAQYASAFGRNTIANEEAQFVLGTNNETGSYLFAVGNGDDNDNRSNAFEIYKSNAITIGDAEAQGAYSVAAGTNDSSLAGNFGSTVSVDKPTAQGDLSLSFGAGTKALTSGTMALGANTTAGCKGYYWWSIDFTTTDSNGATTPTIQLSTSQKTLLNFSRDIPTNLTWEVGDVISIVNKSKYVLCSTIKTVDTTNGVITVDSLPFTSTETVLFPMFDDFSVCCPSKPAAGEVDLGFGAFAIGLENKATGSFSHVEGWNNLGAGDFSHAEGRDNTAGYAAHAEGSNTTASGERSHSEGKNTEASGYSAHAEGEGSIASGPVSHAEGYITTSSGFGSHTEGNHTTASGNYSHAEGGGGTDINDEDSRYSQAHSTNAHAEGGGSLAYAPNSHAEGRHTQAGKSDKTGQGAHSEGWDTRALKTAAHAEGKNTEASGNWSHAEGESSTAFGVASHAEGSSTNAFVNLDITESSTDNEIIEIWKTTKFSMAKGLAAHVEGGNNLALGDRSHAEGNSTIAKGGSSHTEGYLTQALANNSHAQGHGSIAKSARSSAEGNYTIAASINQHVQGKYNIEDSTGKIAHIVGNGTSDADRSNAHTLDWDGNAWFAGDVYVGGTSMANATKLENLNTNNLVSKTGDTMTGKLILPTADIKTNGMSLISFYDNDTLCGVVGADNSVHHTTYLINYHPDNSTYNGYLLPTHSGSNAMYHFLTTKDIVASTTELNYSQGLTGNIQEQINNINNSSFNIVELATNKSLEGTSGFGITPVNDYKMFLVYGQFNVTTTGSSYPYGHVMIPKTLLTSGTKNFALGTASDSKFFSATLSTSNGIESLEFAGTGYEGSGVEDDTIIVYGIK